PVFAVGAPFGLSGSVTSGIVSARGREIGSGPYDDFIQVDAPINKGNSGGPLFDSKGNVVGVNTAIYSPSGGSVGIGFSIPSDLAQTIVAEIVNTGSVERGWLGVQIQDVTNDIAKSLGLEKTQGVIVSEVEDNSPAKSSGLESGDIILSFGDVEILDVGDLTLAVATSDIGKDVDMKVYRGGDVITLNANVTVLETPSDNDFGELGLALSEQGDEVIVMDIQPDSNAASTRIQKGDVLSSINQKPITSIKDVNEAVSKALKLERKSIFAQIKRQDRKRFLTIPLTTS
ncbi:MAG: PDZ domain-containing protein, partial [Amylibacter sp.]